MIPKYWTPKDATVGALRVVQFIGQPALFITIQAIAARRTTGAIRLALAGNVAWNLYAISYRFRELGKIIRAIRTGEMIPDPDLAAAWAEGHQEGFWNGKLADQTNLTGDELIGKEHELDANPYRER